MTGMTTVRTDDLHLIMQVAGGMIWDPERNPDIATAWQRVTEAKDAPGGSALVRRGHVPPDLPACAAARRRAELERLLCVEALVRVTNPDFDDAGWTGRIVGLADLPTILIERADGKRFALPQAFVVDELPAPATDGTEAMF
jgi:hypothetical protein